MSRPLGSDELVAANTRGAKSTGFGKGSLVLQILSLAFPSIEIISFFLVIVSYFLLFKAKFLPP